MPPPSRLPWLRCLPLLALGVMLRAEDFLFVTFKDPGNTGVFFAHSNDALTWKLLNRGQPVVTPTPAISTARDPFIARDPRDQSFHLIWTSGPRGFGYSHSTDLVTWSKSRRLTPEFPGDPKVVNLWAPELTFDPARKVWLLYWSSTLEGHFPETAGQVDNNKNHRIYACETTDFKTFTPARVFFDPGYPVIDASIAAAPNGTWLLAFKDERDRPLRKQLLLASAASPSGPWTPLTSKPLTPHWTEGPTLLRHDNHWYLYFDRYKPGDAQRMLAQRSADLKTWEPVETQFPEKTKHGAIIAITSAEAEKILTTFPVQP